MYDLDKQINLIVNSNALIMQSHQSAHKKIFVAKMSIRVFFSRRQVADIDIHSSSKVKHRMAMALQQTTLIELFIILRIPCCAVCATF